MSKLILSFFRQTWLVLILASGLSAGLAGVDYALRDRIAENSRTRLEQAVLEVVPRAAASESITMAGGPMYRVRDSGGAVCGWAAAAESRGFQDRIRLMVGLSADGRQITGVTILESSETPGLGDRIQQAGFRGQFAGKSTADSLTRTRPGVSVAAGVDAITGATISSDAVIDAVNRRVSAIVSELTSNSNTSAEAIP